MSLTSFWQHRSVWKKLVVFLLAISALAAGWCFLSFLPGFPIHLAYQYNSSKVAPELRALHPPFSNIAAYNYLDGGSVGISFKDSSGLLVRFVLPVTEGSDREYIRNYRHIFADAVEPGDVHAREIVYSLDTKIMLISILQHGSVFDRQRNIALSHLKASIEAEKKEAASSR